MNKFYSLKNILSKNATYNVIYGERSNGKTYSVLKYALKNYINNGEQLGIIRRFTDDFTGKRGQMMFSALTANREIQKMTGGVWSDIYYLASKWYLCRYENDKRVVDSVPFAYGFSLTSMEHDKSTSYPDITTILFDEFMTRFGYLMDEFILFTNTLSTIIRQRDNVKIFMLGNTVNKFCPYFQEMGLKHIQKMQPGNIDVYSYGDSRLKVAVEYTNTSSKLGKKSDFYFAFDNPKLSMIKNGSWEIDIYPHIKDNIKPEEILLNFFVVFNENILHCKVVNREGDVFIYVHPKTTPLKQSNNDIIYSQEYSTKPNYRRKLIKPTNNLEKKIAMLFIQDKVFYSDNDTGEIMRNYLLWCKKDI